jgi:hypothetical protein
VYLVVSGIVVNIVVNIVVVVNVVVSGIVMNTVVVVNAVVVAPYALEVHSEVPFQEIGVFLLHHPNVVE